MATMIDLLNSSFRGWPDPGATPPPMKNTHRQQYALSNMKKSRSWHIEGAPATAVAPGAGNPINPAKTYPLWRLLASPQWFKAPPPACQWAELPPVSRLLGGDWLAGRGGQATPPLPRKLGVRQWCFSGGFSYTRADLVFNTIVTPSAHFLRLKGDLLVMTARIYGRKTNLNWS